MNSQEEWEKWALCLLLELPTHTFFPEENRTGEVAKAKAVCFECEVRTDCLNSAILRGEKYGIWGGLTEHERVEFSTTSVIQAMRLEREQRKRQREQERLAYASPSFLACIPDLKSHNQQVYSTLVEVRMEFHAEQPETLEHRLFELLSSGPNQKPLVSLSSDEFSNLPLLERLLRRLNLHKQQSWRPSIPRIVWE